MSKRFSQQGFAPIVLLALLALIGSVIFVVKSIPLNQPQPIPDKGFQGSRSAQIKSKPSPTITAKLNTQVLPTVTSSKSTPTPTNKPSSSNNSSSNSNNNSNSSNNNSQNPTNTSTPAPTTPANPTNTPAPTPTPTPQVLSPYVRVTYPKGGESLLVGDNITVTWDTNMVLGSCQIQTIDSNNSGLPLGNPNVTNRAISWTVSMGNTTLTERQYKIYMICHDFNGGTQFATSDNYFTIHK